MDQEPQKGDYPRSNADDPLKDKDDPAADAALGIVSRDGGHFEAVFSEGAESFAEAVADLLDRTLPGLRFRISIDGGEPLPWSGAKAAPELPVFGRCDWSGQGLASNSVKSSVSDRKKRVSEDVRLRYEAGKRAAEGQAGDLASLMLQRTNPPTLTRPQTFEDLAQGGYLAVIHADGNGVGRAAPEDPAARSRFHHRNRVLLRQALKHALEQEFGKAEGTIPVLPLMLGGDDLLAMSRADVALSFVKDLCAELERLQENRGEVFHLTLGIGVVFSRPTVPFHRLHEVAENLAASAKRRAAADHAASVVDWAVYTAAWADDPEEARRRDWICSGANGQRRLLSRRPLDVVGDGLGCLQGLLEGAKALKAAPRSQLRYLVEQLPRGQSLAELAFQELSEKARRGLKDAGISEGVWQPGQDGEPSCTSVLDLVEVFEIAKLGRAEAKKRYVRKDDEELDDDEEVGDAVDEAALADR